MSAACEICLCDLPAKVRNRPRVDYVLAQAAIFFDITMKDLTSKGRKRKHVLSRMFIARYIKRNWPYSLLEIGNKLGGRDHSTVHHMFRLYSELSKPHYGNIVSDTYVDMTNFFEGKTEKTGEFQWHPLINLGKP